MSGVPVPERQQEALKGKGYVNSGANWSDEWATPQDFFDALDVEFHFTLDACAKPWSAKCMVYFGPPVDALERQWFGRVWLNPPYSEIGRWLATARMNVERGWCSLVVALVPCVPDRKWWADHVEGKASEVRHVSGKRLYFTAAEGEKPKRAPFPSCVIVYRGSDAD